MRRLVWIGSALTLAALSVAVLVFVLAAVNLDRIIEANRFYLLDTVSGAVGRRVSVQRISAKLGWGVSLKLEDVAIAEDAAFASKGEPFFHAKVVFGRVSALPLLAGRVEIGRLAFEDAQIRLIRNAQGRFNFATLGTPPATASPTAGPAQSDAAVRSVALWSQSGPAGPGRFKSLTLESLSLVDSEVIYTDAMYAVQATLHKVDLTIEPLDIDRVSNVAMRLALLGNEQNFRLDGRVGPMGRDGRLDFAAAPLDLTIVAGPFVLDRVKSLSAVANRTLAALSIPDPVSLNARVSGSVGAPVLTVNSDLTQAKVFYGGLFAKPSGVALRLALQGKRRVDGFSLSAAELTVANLHATVSDFLFAPGRIKGDLRADRFELSPWSALLPALKDYRLSGSAQAHAKADLQGAKLLLNGALELAQAGATPQGNGAPRLSGLNAVVDFAGDTATLEPAEFHVGNARVTLRGRADSLNPLHGVYALSSPEVSAADIIDGYVPEQYRAQALAASGDFTVGEMGAIVATTSLTSTNGRVANVPYRDLTLKASLSQLQLRLESARLKAYGGALDASGAMSLDKRLFTADVNAAGIDLGQAADEQGAANGSSKIRGQLTGRATVSGRGEKFAEIQPTLRGEGRFVVVNGAVPGINPAAAIFKALGDTPGLSMVLSPDLAARYPRVFRSHDMQFESASASFKIDGPQISSQDMKVVAPDYTISGAGWINLDQRLNIKAEIVLSTPFSRALLQRSDVLALMADPVSQVHVPLVMSGTLSRLSVRPDVGAALQRVRPGAVENLGKKLLRNLFK
jgi:uncharacterized protein involved in outer membrane biogenesis